MPERIAPSVRLVGTDEFLFRRITSLLPEGISVERFQSLEEVGVPPRPPAFTLYQVEHIDDMERRRIERYLQESPRRLMVFCNRADPPVLFRLTVTGAATGLVAIETDRSKEFLEERLKSWYWGGLIRPDWVALGAKEDVDPSYHVGRMIKMIERNPFYDWRVEELARRLRISKRTLNRAVQFRFGRPTKTVLMALRFQLLERAREIGQRTWEELAGVFGFQSAKELHEWRREYQKRS